MQVIYAEGFGADLDAITDFISVDNPQRAVTFVAEIWWVCTNLIIAYPRAGRTRPKFGADMHSFATHGVTIFYTFEPDLDRLKFYRVVGRQDISRRDFRG